MMLGLRLLEEGVMFERFASRFGVDVRDVYQKEIERLAKQGLIEVHVERVRLSRQGRVCTSSQFQRQDDVSCKAFHLDARYNIAMIEQPPIRIERQRRATQIIDRLKACLADVLAGYPVEMAYLYGSVARGRPLPSSDIDIALMFTERLMPYQRLTLELDVQAALEEACGLTGLDVRSINHAPLTVQGQIVQEGLLLYERDRDRRIAFEASIRRKYFDYQPTAERMQRAFLDHVRRKGLTGGRSQHHHIHSE